VVNLAYPFGEYDARVIEAAKASGYRSGRSVEEGYNSRFDLERFDIRVQNVTRDTTVDEFRSWVDYAEEHRYWLVLVYHEVVPDSAPVCTDPETVDPCLGAYHTTVSRFQAQLSYIDAQLGAGNVLTVEQALAAAEADIHAPLAGTVTMTPAQPRRGSVVTATPSGFTDPDGGALTFRFRWRVNGIAIGGATQPTLDLSQRAGRGDVVAVGVVAEDGDGHSSAEVGSSVTVANTPPTTGSVAIYPSAPAAGVTLTATPSGFVDPDGDALTFAYTWLRNGQVVPGATGPSPAAAAVAAGDTLRVDTRASDGHGGESGPAAATVTVHGATPASPAQVADRSGPTITIRSPRARTYGLGSKLTISFRCRDSSGVTRRKATLRRRGGRLRSVKPGKRVRLERAGRYVLRVTATDANGNTAARTVAFRVAKR
jgi:hypothetical protein